MSDGSAMYLHQKITSIEAVLVNKSSEALEKIHSQ
jgi:hypothetical protein